MHVSKTSQALPVNPDRLFPAISPQEFRAGVEMTAIQLLAAIVLGNMCYHGYKRRTTQTAISGGTVGVLFLAEGSVKNGLTSDNMKQSGRNVEKSQDLVNSLRGTLVWQKKETEAMLIESKKQLAALQDSLEHAKEEAIKDLTNEHGRLREDVEALRIQKLGLEAANVELQKHLTSLGEVGKTLNRSASMLEMRSSLISSAKKETEDDHSEIY
ncbi:MAG: hypothetical protein HRU43_03260 [Simkaniaceae bacterium]|nr:hypothetical protein [Simkaniaceae bacterium]